MLKTKQIKMACPGIRPEPTQVSRALCTHLKSHYAAQTQMCPAVLSMVLGDTFLQIALKVQITQNFGWKIRVGGWGDWVSLKPNTELS